MSKPFDPDAYLAKKQSDGFDPDAYLAKKKGVPMIPEQPEDGGPGLFDATTKAGAALRGFGEGASYGFSDELSGLVGEGVAGFTKGLSGLLRTAPGRALVRKYMGDGASALPASAIDAITKGAADQSLEQATGIKADSVRTPYQQARDASRSDISQAQEANPGTFLASSLAGSIAAPGPKGGKMTVGGAVLKPWAGRALTGFGVGAMSGLGASTEDTLGGVALDALGSGGAGAVAGPVLGTVADRAGGAFARWLEKRSRINALKAIGLEGGISNKAKQLGYDNVDDLAALGAKMRDEGDIIKPFGTPAGVAQRLEGALDEASGAKQAAVDEIERMAQEQGRKFDFNALATRAEDAVIPPEGWDPLSRQSAGKALDMLGAASAAEGGFPMAEQVRRAAGKRIAWKAPAFGQALPEEISMQRKAYGAIADEIQRQAQDVEARAVIASGKTPGPEDLGASNQISSMNKRISSLMDASALSNEQATREASRGVGLKDLIIGGAGTTGLMATGHSVAGPLAGLLMAGASSFARNRLPSAMTYAQKSMSKALPSLSQYGGLAAIKAVTGAEAAQAQQNAFGQLAKRFGINAKSREELANEAFVRGQTAQ